MTRREWIVGTSATLAAAAPGAYRVAQSGGRWWLIDPAGARQFSLGLNHIDPATLRYPGNPDLWKTKYRGSMRLWLQQSVRPNLLAWGFNCVGWTQEVVTRGDTNRRHSRPFTFEEYQWLDFPHCHLLPFADFHQWEAETRLPNLYSQDFADWCDHVAREHCAVLARDPKLIGYFYVDCPTWVHTRRWSVWRGPLFDPEKLNSDAGRRELHELATRYYKVTHDAVRRYDKHHLILGDRYEAMAPLPREVVLAAAPYIDVLSFQHFGAASQVKADLARWHEETGKPVLLADGARNAKSAGPNLRHDVEQYGEVLRALREIPGAIGFHLCGAYLANRVRKRGLLDEREQPDHEVIAGIRAANQTTARWAAEWRT